jgi:predicted GNAT family N-acyltransferase
MLLTFEEYIKKKFIYNREKYDLAKTKKYLLFKKFCDNINIEYIKEKCKDNNNKILLYSINGKECNDIIGILMYRIILNNKQKLRIYLTLMSVKEQMREYGYGKLLLNELIEKFNMKNKNIEIVLLSIPESYHFYENNGFIQKNIKYIEKNEDTQNNFMMVKYLS